MKRINHIIFLSIPFFTLWFCTSFSGIKDKESGNASQAADTGNKSVVVLELFTSQGCSSCPSADRLLGTYTSNENVIPLSFHVDYWNRLGWKDPFSSKEYTKRQYNYSSALNANVYTPQLVINGEAEMVGSDANKISATIQKIISQEHNAELSIKSVNYEDGKANISFDASGNISNAVLNIAIVEKKTTTDIKAGENSGATLDNFNVVRNFKTIGKINNGNNTSFIDVPPNTNQNNFSVVIYLQDKANHKISTGAQATL